MTPHRTRLAWVSGVPVERRRAFGSVHPTDELICDLIETGESEVTDHVTPAADDDLVHLRRQGGMHAFQLLLLNGEEVLEGELHADLAQEEAKASRPNAVAEGVCARYATESTCGMPTDGSVRGQCRDRS